VTTEAPSRPVPTPGDLAARQKARRAAELLEPGTLHRGERFRPLFEQGVRASKMTPHARLVALTLLTFANAGTGELPPERQPFLDGLTEATGLNRGQVVVQLRVLETRGWVRRHPASPPAYEQALLRPVIPRFALDRLRAS